jgi:hypothetical protein
VIPVAELDRLATARPDDAIALAAAARPQSPDSNRPNLTLKLSRPDSGPAAEPPA